MRYEEVSKFTRDFKKLLKKFQSLADDFKTAKKNSVELFHKSEINNNGIFEIQGARNTEELQFFKIKKFACKSLPGRGVQSGIRITYAYFPNEQKVVFLEIYFKAQKENEDKTRIANFLSSHQTVI